MELADIAPDDILMFNEDLRIDDDYVINGMLGHDVFVVDEDGEVVDQIDIDDLEDTLKARVLEVIDKDKFELRRNE